MSGARRRALALALGIGASLAASPAPAFAFETFESYGQDVGEGGGGGRYFTGSFSDGYVCSVCHFGGEEGEGIELELPEGLLEDGYTAGQTYTIELRLPTNTNQSAATLELVDGEGVGAGTLELIPVTAQSTEEQCTLDFREPDDLVAAHIATLEAPSRQVAGLDVCGAERLVVRWTAPPRSTGQVWLHAAVVAATGDLGAASGDFCTRIERVIPSSGAVPDPGTTMTGCAVGGAPSGAWWLLAVGLFWVGRRRR